MPPAPAVTSLPAAAAPWPWPAALRVSAALHAGALGAALLWPASWPWAAGAVVLNHAALTAAGLWPRSRWLGPNVTRLPPAAAARGEIAITIDDGPDPEVTPTVLDLLAAAGVHATFFCIGEHARRQPALVRRIVAEGHGLQNHSLRHRHHFSLLGPRALEREIAAAQELLAEIGGTRPHCFRAPAGLRNPLLDPVLHRLGLHLVSWTRRGYDTRDADSGRVLGRLLGAAGPAAGEILLLHDGHARRDAGGRALVLEMLPRLLAACRDAGLRPVTLERALPPRHAT